MRVFDVGARDAARPPDDRVLTVPNVLSLARLAALPLLWADLTAGRFGRALVVLGLSAATDWFDGYLARRLDQRTRLGALLDPLGDRLLLLVAGVGLVAAGILPWWPVVLLVAREGTVGLAGAVLVARGRTVPETSRLGKAATFGLLWALPLLLAAAWAGEGAAAPQPVLAALGWTALLVNLALSYVTAVGYARSVRGGRG
ncbi:MAG: CDP-alcohol phosphatidyltransferase family protein [Nitriliruptoraceae bacterium]